MVTRIFTILKKEIGGLHEAAFLLAFFALSSQFLALIRDRLLAHTFGAGSTLDIYYAAFRVPDFLYTSIASFVSLTVLIPFLSRYLTETSEDSLKAAREFLGSVFSLFLYVILAVSAAAFLLMPKLAPFIAPGFSADQTAQLILLSRVLLLSPIILGVSNLFGSITQVFKRFFVYALAPVLYNVGIIAGIIFFYPRFGLVGLAGGVILGALFHLFVQWPVVAESGIRPPLTARVNFGAVWEVITLSLPRTVTLSASYFALIVLVAMASTVHSGSVSVFNFAFNLQSVPLSIIGVSYSLAAFPTLASFFSRGQRDEFAEHIVTALRHVIFWSLPVMALFIVLRAQIVRVILGSGSFSWTDTRLVAAALSLFVVSLVAQGAVLLLVRGFYAAGETKVPLLVNLTCSLLIILLAIVSRSLFEHTLSFRYFMESLLRVEGLRGTGVLMLPLAYSLGLIINALALWLFFERRHIISSPGALSRTSFEGFAAAVCLGFISYLFLNVFANFFNINTFAGIFFQGLFAAVFGVVFGVVLLKLLKSRELEDITAALRSRFWKTEVIPAEMGEL